jgi:hypothetical protein
MGLFGGAGRSQVGVLAGQDLQNQQIRGMERRDRDMIQVFIGLRDVPANQDAKLLYGHTQLLSCLGFGELSLVLLGGERTCVHGPNAF